MQFGVHIFPTEHSIQPDELARAAKKDPVQFRLDMLDDARYRKVIEVVAEKSNWNAPRKKGNGKRYCHC